MPSLLPRLLPHLHLHSLSKRGARALLLAGLLCAPLLQAADFQVTNTNDDTNPGSLRWAITQANTNAGDDNISFASSADGTLTLSSSLPSIAANGTLTITGNGTANTIISGGGTVQIMSVAGGASLDLSGVSLVDGYTSGQGAAILSYGSLSLDTCYLNGNTAASNGGAIYASDSLSLTDTIVDGNTTTGSWGGGVTVRGQLTVIQSLITNNTAPSGGGGGLNISASAEVYNSTFSGNSALYGGSAFVLNTGDNSNSVTLNNTLVAGNAGTECRTTGHGTINAVNSLFGSASCAFGTSTNNLTGDPALNADHTLSNLSIAINAGNNTLNPGGLTSDLAGNARVQQGTVDIGAYESPYQPPVTLTYTAGFNGSISGDTPQTVAYGGSGSAVSANPAAHYHFVQWSDGSTANPRTDTNVMANVSVTASFSIDTYTLSYAAGANGSISGTSPQTVAYGGSGTAVTANPAAHYHFVQWSDGSTANPRTDTNVMANISVTASFAADTFTLTYTAGANGSISGTSPQTVNYGSDGSAVTADPAAGYHFVQWSDGSTANPRTDSNVTANVSVTASFAADIPVVSIAPAAAGISEGGSTGFTISRTGLTTSALTVSLTLSPGSGMTTADYSLSGGTISGQSGSVSVTIPSAQSSVVVNAAAVDDAVAEATETLSLTLLDQAAYDLGTPSSATLSISDNDSAGITVTPTAVNVTEGGATASFSVRATSAPTANVSLPISSDGQCSVSPSPVILTAGNSNAVVVTVTAVDDDLIEGTHSCAVTTGDPSSTDPLYNALTAADVADVTATVTDNDLPAVSISPAAANVAEGSSAAFTISRTGPTTNALSVNLVLTPVDGISTADYGLAGGSVSGQSGSVTLTIPAGSAAADLTFAATDDAEVEPDETLRFTLAAGSGYGLGTASEAAATIPANDAVRSFTAPLPNDGGDVTLTIAGGAVTCSLDLDSTALVAVDGLRLPEGWVFPLGAVSFRATGCGIGATLTVSLIFPPETQLATLWKLGATAEPIEVGGATIDGNTISYSITDGGPLDADGVADGVINDPVAPSALGSSAASVPSLNPWGLALLAGLLLTMGMIRVRQGAC